MAIPDTETILAAVGLVLTAAVWAVERFLPGRKRIGYRIQMDAPIAMNPRVPKRWCNSGCCGTSRKSTTPWWP